MFFLLRYSSSNVQIICREEEKMKWSEAARSYIIVVSDSRHPRCQHEIGGSTTYLGKGVRIFKNKGADNIHKEKEGSNKEKSSGTK